jgi:hypothetical protein
MGNSVIVVARVYYKLRRKHDKNCFPNIAVLQFQRLEGCMALIGVLPSLAG